MHPFIDFFGHRLVSYEVMTTLGVVAGGLYFYWVCASIPLKKTHLLLFLALNLPVQYFGGKIIPLMYHAFMAPGPKPPLNSYWMQWSGRYFHSAFLTALVYLLLACKIFRWPTRKLLDEMAIGVLLASAIGRVGCLMQGCCRGKPCDLPWAIHIRPDPTIGVHPTQAYMIIAETAMMVFLWNYKKKKKYDGEVFWMAVLFYSIYRIWIEFLRAQNPAVLFGLTHAQIFSIFSLGLSGYVLFINAKKNTLQNHGK